MEFIKRLSRGLLVFICLIFLSLMGCASSSLSHSAADNIDSAYQSSNSLVTNAGGVSPEDAMQNSSEITRGAVVGGAAGAVAVGLTSGPVGILPGAAGGAVFGGIIGAYIERNSSLIDQLENHGVKVLIFGDEILLVLPSAWTFQGMTPTIRPQAYPTLELIAKFLRGLTTMSIRVSAYTNDVGDPQINCAITQQQANSMVRYLWPRISTRVLTGMGYGGTHLIERNNMTWDRGANYRIEIRLEKLPV